MPDFPKNEHFLPRVRTMHTCAYQGIRNVLFCRKFGVLCFLETPVLRFALLPYYRQITFVSATKIDKNKPAFWTNIFHDKFTLLDIKLTIYIYENKLTSQKQYSFGLTFSGNLKRTHADQVYNKFFLCKNNLQTFKSSNYKKLIFQCYLINTSVVLTNFIPCDNWKACFFIKVLFKRLVVTLFETSDLKEVCISFFISTVRVPW